VDEVRLGDSEPPDQDGRDDARDEDLDGVRRRQVDRDERGQGLGRVEALREDLHLEVLHQEQREYETDDGDRQPARQRRPPDEAERAEDPFRGSLVSLRTDGHPALQVPA